MRFLSILSIMKQIRFFSLIIITLIILHGLSPIAMAHPLGNFTINHYAGLHVTQKAILIDYVLDMAEIPTFQEMATFDANGNGQAETSEAASYHPDQCEFVRSGLSLAVSGRPHPLSVTASAIEFPAGAGGLPTLRLTCTIRADLDGQRENIEIAFENHVYSDRLGWREIVVTSEGVTLEGDLAAMTKSRSHRLTDYPDDLLNSPPNQRQVAFRLNPTVAADRSGTALATTTEGSNQPAINRNDRFTELIMLDHLTLPAVTLALVIAFIWGAAHALTPGHGKTIVAAYLVGSRGTIQHALFLGLTTTITHTAGVFILGFLTLVASRFILPEQLYPWLGVLSGGLVVWIGFSLFRGQLMGLMKGLMKHKVGAPALEHAHDEIGPAGLYHQHGAGPAHHHLPPDATGEGGLSWRNLLALGISGGLIPCPSALVVMLGAIALQRIGFGLVLIIAFSLGLAGVLTAMGVIWVQARRLFERSPRHRRFLDKIPGRGRWLQVLPAASALFITVAGVGITLQALIQTGLLS